MSARSSVSSAALAILFAGAAVAAPSEPSTGEGAARPPKFARVVVLGIDGLDPDILQETIELFPERMPNFARIAKENGIHPLGTSTPPQSPVAWSNFITGLDPGGHGIFDFLHRDPTTRAAIASTTHQDPAKALELWGDWKLPTGGGTLHSNRTGLAFWKILAEHGVPADIWRMPANFPVEPARGWSFSGMMTPAIDSAYGKCTIFTTDRTLRPLTGDARVIMVELYSDAIDSEIPGPPNGMKQGDPPTSVPLRIVVDREANAAALDVGGRVIVLEPGEWSDFVPVTFSMAPMGLMDIGGIVRFYLRSIAPEFELYASPVNIDPSAPPGGLEVSQPSSASADVADVARGIGPFYTQGMPEDVNALKSAVITVREFMQQAELVQQEGERMLDFALERYLAKDEGGFLFFYFSGVDLCSHMMWRHADEQHPDHDPELAAEDSSWWSHRPGSSWKDVIHDLYLQMDPVLGRVRERVGEDTTLIVMSDHGFAPYRRRFGLNRWLYDQGYLVLREGCVPELDSADPKFHEVSVSSYLPRPAELAAGSEWPLRTSVDWSKTRAYGVGFNGLYLNLAGRERDIEGTPDDEAGIVAPEQAEALLREIAAKLEALDDGGTKVVLRASLARDVYSGARVADAPDLLVGYNAGYDNSDEASLGHVTSYVLADNDRGRTFNGSHLMAPEVVAGTLLSNRRVRDGAHRLEDLTVEVLARYNLSPGAGMQGKPVLETDSH